MVLKTMNIHAIMYTAIEYHKRRQHNAIKRTNTSFRQW